MKVFRTLVAALAVAAFTILAQTLLTMGASSAETIPQAPPANVAIIDSSAFSNERTGIARVMNGMKALEVKFQPLRTEIRGMRERLNTMRADIQKKRATQDPRATAQQTEEAERLDVQIKRKQEDAQASFQRETQAILEPVQNDIAAALNAYAQSKGITLVLDANRVPIIYAASGIDITRAFIDDYNRKFPAAAAPATTSTAPVATPTPARPATTRPTPRPGRP
jgi:Skp family chaperone for outer membrane proteins